jgi:hypothetical protein
LVWLAAIDDNLRTQPKHFWKYISKIKGKDQSVTQIEVGEKIIIELKFIAEAFADCFCSIFKSSSSVNTPNNSDYICSHFFLISRISLMQTLNRRLIISI